MHRTLSLLFLILTMALPSSLHAQDEESPTIAVYDLTGILSEGGQEEANLFSYDLSGGRPLTHFDLVRSLQEVITDCLLYTSPSPRDQRGSRMPSSA